jgi:2-keto-4-pentenoate hydratase/2-oxohepta-3-ene-1,7-dioic acid hydratase in catechol pathway
VKIATFRHQGQRRVGVVDPEKGSIAPFDLPAEKTEDGVVCLIGMNPLPTLQAELPLAEVTLEAPLPRPRRNVFCVGKNYYDHAEEFSKSGFDSSAAAGSVPKVPIVFSKVPESVAAPGAPILIDPAVSTAVDYEVELTVIIGREGRNIPKEKALDYVWGYTIVNDVTARDIQGRHSQWLLGKSQDSFCPMGPWAVTKDEIDLADTAVRTFVNGEKRQDSNTGLLIFDVPTIIAAISNGITLLPGDVIATGTPAGVGIGFDPPKYLKAGDVVRLEIDGIGTLENTCEEMKA